MHIERESQPFCMKPMSPDCENLFERSQCMLLDLKAKTSWLHIRHECAYELEDNFNELFQHVELESISKDWSNAAICMGCHTSNRPKDVCSGFHGGERPGIK